MALIGALLILFVIVGAFFLVISLVFLIPYYQNYVPTSTDSSFSEEILSSSAS